MIDTQESIESKIAYVREQREMYADKIFDAKNRIKKDASKLYKSLYNTWDMRLRKLQAVQNSALAIERKQQNEQKLQSLGLTIGETYKYPRTGTIGRLRVDSYGYLLLDPIDKTGIHPVALYSHSVRELQKISG